MGFAMLKSVLGFGRKPTQEELNEVQSEIDGSPVFMATRTWCPLCKTAEATLKEYPVDMKVVEMNHRDDGDQFQAALMQITGQKTIPYIFIGGKFIGGNSDLQTLKTNKKLDGLLEEYKKK